MLHVLRFSRTPLHWTNFLRSVFYETLALQCVALLWLIAWADALEARVKLELEPHEYQPIRWVDHHPVPDGSASQSASIANAGE